MDIDYWSVITDYKSTSQILSSAGFGQMVARPMAKQSERRAATRSAITTAARTLFGTQGFAVTTVDAIAIAAGVAKGAIYHHFETKEALFEAVFETVSAELAREVFDESLAARDVLAAIDEGTRLYFEKCTRGPTGRIVLKDGPAVLGWERWRALDLRYFGGMMPRGLDAAMRAGLIARQPVEPLAGLLLGAVNEAAVACAASSEPGAVAQGYSDALAALLNGLRVRESV